MPLLRGKCDSCGANVDIQFGQTANRWSTGLAWWQAYQCQECGNAVEADGGQDIPESYRQMILDQDGIWTVQIAAEGHLSVHTLKAICNVLGLSLAQTTEIMKSGSTCIASGTRAEMEQIRLDLANKNIETTVTKEERV